MVEYEISVYVCLEHEPHQCLDGAFWAWSLHKITDEVHYEYLGHGHQKTKQLAIKQGRRARDTYIEDGMWTERVTV